MSPIPKGSTSGEKTGREATPSVQRLDYRADGRTDAHPAPKSLDDMALVLHIGVQIMGTKLRHFTLGGEIAGGPC